MNTDVLILVLTGALAMFSPLAIAVAKRESWSKIAKVGVPIVVALAIAAVYTWLKGQTQLVTVDDWLNAFLTVFAIQQLAYTTFLRWLATILEQVGNKDSAADPAQDGEPKHSA